MDLDIDMALAHLGAHWHPHCIHFGQTAKAAEKVNSIGAKDLGFVEKNILSLKTPYAKAPDAKLFVFNGRPK